MVIESIVGKSILSLQSLCKKHRHELELKAGSMNEKDIETILHSKAEMQLNCSSDIQGPVDLARKGAFGFGRRKYKSGS